MPCVRFSTRLSNWTRTDEVRKAVHLLSFAAFAAAKMHTTEVNMEATKMRRAGSSFSWFDGTTTTAARAGSYCNHCEQERNH